MAKNDVEFRVGVIILLGIIILAVSIYWLRDYKLEQNSKMVQVSFGDVGTLTVGDNVTVSGMRKGKVKKMTLTENGVTVEMMLANDVRITKGTRFVIKNLGVMGERYIAITQGEDTTTVPTDVVFQGEYDTGIPEVMGLLGEMMVELRTLVRSFKNTIGSDSSLTKFNRTITNLELVSKSLSDYLENNERNLNRTADNFYQASESFKNIVKDNKTKIDSTAVRIDRITGNMENLITQLDSLSLSFRQFADNINNPEGTLQLLTEDRRLYDDLRKTADNIDDLITDIKANPRKYINLKVEIF